MQVKRNMRVEQNEKPSISKNTTRDLYARVRDLHPRVDGVVDPGYGGLSVIPADTGPYDSDLASQDPSFLLDTEDLPDGLRYRVDPANPEGHGFIEPSEPMKFEIFQRLIHQTRDSWTPV